MSSISSFIPSEEIKKLTFGSYEQLKAQVEESIEASREKLFGSQAPVQVLGTFAGYAIVLSEDAKVFRVKFEKTQAGGISPLMAESLSVTAYKPETMGDFVTREARAYVDAYMGGSKSVATEHLKNLLPIVPSSKGSLSSDKIVESFGNLVHRERGWKKVYTEKLAQIRGEVKDDLPKLDEQRTHDKFRRLYDGSVVKAELPTYRDLVTSDINYLEKKIDYLLSETEKSVTVFKGAVPALKKEQADQTVKMFESFSEDYVADLKGVKKALTETAEHLNNVDDFGKVHDLLANELYRYEVAGKFVAKMSRRLAEAAVTEEG